MELRTLLLRIAMRLHVNPRSSTVQQVMYRCAPPGKRHGSQLHWAMSGPYAWSCCLWDSAAECSRYLQVRARENMAQGCHELFQFLQLTTLGIHGAATIANFTIGC